MRRTGLPWLIGVIALYAIAFLVYAETKAFTWDESYHLVAAQLINAGKRPYINFCFPQTPLNAYWNAGLMRILGENWRVPHLFAALFTIAAVLMTARYVYVRFPLKEWRVTAALTTALLFGLNAAVFVFGALAQAYGICLFMLVAAFWAAVIAVEKERSNWSAVAGLCAGSAAASSLLTAAAAPVFLVWIAFNNRVGSRWQKAMFYSLATAIPFTPVIWLLIQGPQQTWFNVIQYHAVFRSLYWPETTRHDLEMLASWIDSGQALFIGLFAVTGLACISRRSNWSPALKAEYYLCAWLAAALAAEVSRAHPTFTRYFVLTVPFVAILASVGFYAIVSRALRPHESLWVVGPLAVLLLFGLSKFLYERREFDWNRYQELARKVEEVTPRASLLYANEPIYFLTKRIPPPGLELYYTHKLDLGARKNALFHLIPGDDLKREVESGRFAAAYSCDDDEISDFGLEKLYKKRADLLDCSIFWDLRPR